MGMQDWQDEELIAAYEQRQQIRRHVDTMFEDPRMFEFLAEAVCQAEIEIAREKKRRRLGKHYHAYASTMGAAPVSTGFVAEDGRLVSMD